MSEDRATTSRWRRIMGGIVTCLTYVSKAWEYASALRPEWWVVAGTSAAAAVAAWRSWWWVLLVVPLASYAVLGESFKRFHLDRQKARVRLGETTEPWNACEARVLAAMGVHRGVTLGDRAEATFLLEKFAEERQEAVFVNADGQRVVYVDSLMAWLGRERIRARRNDL